MVNGAPRPRSVGIEYIIERARVHTHVRRWILQRGLASNARASVKRGAGGPLGHQASTERAVRTKGELRILLITGGWREADGRGMMQPAI